MKILSIKFALFGLALFLLSLGVPLKYRDSKIPQKISEMVKEVIYFMIFGLILLLVFWLSIFYPDGFAPFNLVPDIFGVVGLGAVFLSVGCFWELIKRSRKFPFLIQIPALVCRLL